MPAMDPELTERLVKSLARLGIRMSRLPLVELLFTAKPADLKVCETRIMREGRGLFRKRVAVHLLPDHKLEITLIDEPP